MGEDWVHLVFNESCPVERVRHRHGMHWEKRPPGMLRDLCSGPPRPVTIQIGKQISQPQRLDRLRNVHLTWSNFFIAGDCCMSIYGDARTAVAGIVKWPGLSEIAGISCRGKDFVVARSRLQNAERIDGRIMFASSNEPHNWGMWLLYVLPAVTYFVQNRHLYDRLLVYAEHPNMQAMLRLLGVEDTDIILHDCSKAYYFDCIDVFRQPTRDFYIAPETKAIFAELRERAAGGIVGPSADRIYIGRRRWTTETNAYRCLTNERELEDRLGMMGYSSIDPAYIGPAAQIALFGSARQIVALGGAALFNAVFCKPGTKIIDIESTPDHLENHSTILSSMDLDYGIILGQTNQNDRSLHNKQWTVDVERAVAAIAEFMG